MKFKKLNTIVVGLGNIGFQYDLSLPINKFTLSHSRAIKKNNKLKLIAGVDINKKSRNSFQKKYNIPVFQSIEKCLDKLKIDLVVISVPTKKQYKVFKILVKKGIKNIICEKPIAFKQHEGKKILDISKKKKINIMINFLRRYNPGIIKLKSMIKKDSLGEVCDSFFWYKKDLKHGGCHFVDLILFFFGKPQKVKNIDYKKNKNSSLIFEYKKFKIFLFSAPKLEFEIGKFELHTTKSIITYEDDEDIKLFKKIPSKYFKNENKLILSKKIKYKKNVNISFVYDEFIKNYKSKSFRNSFYDAFYNLKICNNF